jgi:hypothetical protein
VSEYAIGRKPLPIFIRLVRELAISRTYSILILYGRVLAHAILRENSIHLTFVDLREVKDAQV